MKASVNYNKSHPNNKKDVSCTSQTPPPADDAGPTNEVSSVAACNELPTNVNQTLLTFNKEHPITAQDLKNKQETPPTTNQAPPSLAPDTPSFNQANPSSHKLYDIYANRSVSADSDEFDIFGYTEKGNLHA